LVGVSVELFDVVKCRLELGSKTRSLAGRLPWFDYGGSLAKLRNP
jgi:hypothetical protein